MALCQLLKFISTGVASTIMIFLANDDYLKEVLYVAEMFHSVVNNFGPCSHSLCSVCKP